jgi:hypothetical protein
LDAALLAISGSVCSYVSVDWACGGATAGCCGILEWLVTSAGIGEGLAVSVGFSSGQLWACSKAFTEESSLFTGSAGNFVALVVLWLIVVWANLDTGSSILLHEDLSVTILVSFADVLDLNAFNWVRCGSIVLEESWAGIDTSTKNGKLFGA